MALSRNKNINLEMGVKKQTKNKMHNTTIKQFRVEKNKAKIHIKTKKTTNERSK